ncbi:MAG: YifB family Mg chelatase-like AAA ATPase [Arcanobacterium sp.]|nr:YifB family Mg chelatase-like AAA ATPase [Arcanobacterium sp.]
MAESVVGIAHAMTMLGLEAIPVTIEASITQGLPHFTIVGLPDTAVNEAKERIRAAFHTIGLPWPNSRVTVNLSPAHVSKHGTSFDLGIAVAVLSAQRFRGIPRSTLVMGELGLDGTIRAVRGVLPAVIAAHTSRYSGAVIPAANLSEARLVTGMQLSPVNHLGQVAAMAGVTGLDFPDFPPLEKVMEKVENNVPDLSDVRGQDDAVWAMTVAAAGGHHFQMIGPPGVGKSMLAERIVGILPDLTQEEAMDVAIVRSAYGGDVTHLPQRPPFIAPHHSATIASIVGGGAGVPRPGAVTMADRGVLYFDEFPEFATNVIQALRQPLENGIVEISRSRAAVQFPARFQFIASANPCRCGRLFDGPGKCTCTPAVQHAYRTRLGGPVRDRIDIRVIMRRPHKAHLRHVGVSTSDIKEEVAMARERQEARCKREALNLSVTNARLSTKWLHAHEPKSTAAITMIDRWLESGELSMRGLTRIMRISWTLTDLFERSEPGSDELMLAYGLLTGGDAGAHY